MEEPQTEKLSKRIDELGAKSTQILTFLSFVIIADVTLASTTTDATRKLAMSSALKWWLWALYPVILGILPVKEFRADNIRWYQIVRWSKFVLLWAAALLISLGLCRFVREM